MTTFPVDYFAPNNGQANGLEERVNEAFKSDEQIFVSELGKRYNPSQVTELMSDVTAYFSKNYFSSCVLARADFEDDASCFEKFREEQIYSVPPTRVIFDSQKQLESFISYVFEISGTRVVINHLFPCKIARFGLGLNLKDSEIKGLDENDYPITLSFKAIDDLYDFASAYTASTPAYRVPSGSLCESDSIIEGAHPINNNVTKESISSSGTPINEGSLREQSVAKPSIKKENVVPSKKNQKKATEKSNKSSKRTDIIITSGVLAIAAIIGIIVLVNRLKSANDSKEYYASIQREEAIERDTMPSWVYGAWRWGSVSIIIDFGGITEISYGSLKQGSYRYENGKIKAKYNGEGGIVTVYGVNTKQKVIVAGNGNYFHKVSD